MDFKNYSDNDDIRLMYFYTVGPQWQSECLAVGVEYN